MPQSVTAAASIKVGTGVVNARFSKAATQSGSENFGGTQSIATSATALELGAVSTIGGLFIYNGDSTNYVEIDSANTFDKFPQKILPLRGILLAPQTTTIYAKANTAAVEITVGAYEL